MMNLHVVFRLRQWWLHYYEPQDNLWLSWWVVDEALLLTLAVSIYENTLTKNTRKAASLAIIKMKVVFISQNEWRRIAPCQQVTTSKKKEYCCRNDIWNIEDEQCNVVWWDWDYKKLILLKSQEFTRISPRQLDE
jgi:hypothetical protein